MTRRGMTGACFGVATDVRLLIASNDFPATSGDGIHGRDIMVLGGLGGALHFSRESGERLRAMPLTNSALDGSIGASLVAAAVAFLLHAMPDTNSSLSGSVDAPLLAAAFHLRLRAMPLTNSALTSSIGASLVAAAFHLCARCSDHHGLSRLPFSTGRCGALLKCGGFQQSSVR